MIECSSLWLLSSLSRLIGYLSRHFAEAKICENQISFKSMINTVVDINRLGASLFHFFVFVSWFILKITTPFSRILMNAADLKRLLNF
jgi:hypothetical protein